MDYYPGFDISFDNATHEFAYGKGVYGPKSELRLLDDIRPSFEDPACSGPEVLYSIAMDVGRETDRDMIVERNLLFGVVWYSSGSMGEEPVRFQGTSTPSLPRATIPRARSMRYGMERRASTCSSSPEMMQVVALQSMPRRETWWWFPRVGSTQQSTPSLIAT